MVAKLADETEGLTPSERDQILIFQAVLNTANGDGVDCPRCRLFCRELLHHIEWPMEQTDEELNASEAWRAM